MRRNQGRYKRLIIRLDETEEALIKEVARADFLRPSTWARAALLRAALKRRRDLDRQDSGPRSVRAVAESTPRRKQRPER
ncbi:MAG: hypothetical protein ACREON_12705 [Gemmatimonadaceae bacterium]